MRNILPFPFAPYNGAVSSLPFNGPRGQQKGVVVPLTVAWQTYNVFGQPLGTANTNFCVSLDLNTAGPNTVSGTWTVQSVYIDNLGVNFPVEVYFKDSRMTISAPPDSAGWYRVYTNARSVLIAALGMTDSSVSNAVTQLFFTDVEMTPFVDPNIPQALALYKASPTIPFFNGFLQSSGYDSPALGDQALDDQYPMVSNAGQIMFPAQSNGQWRITNFEIIVSGASQSGGPSTGVISFQMGVAPGTTYFSGSYVWDSSTGGSILQVQNICSIQGCQLKLDATKPYQIVNSTIMGAGVARVHCAYAYLPNG